MGLHTEALLYYIRCGKGSGLYAKAEGSIRVVSLSISIREKDLFLFCFVFMKHFYRARLKIGSPEEAPQVLIYIRS